MNYRRSRIVSRLLFRTGGTVLLFVLVRLSHESMGFFLAEGRLSSSANFEFKRFGFAEFVHVVVAAFHAQRTDTIQQLAGWLSGRRNDDDTGGRRCGWGRRRSGWHRRCRRSSCGCRCSDVGRHFQFRAKLLQVEIGTLTLVT